MRRFKKILSAILITAIIFTFNAFTAFADEQGNSNNTLPDTDISGLQFSKVFEAVNGDELPNAEFQFKMEPVKLEKEGELDANNIRRYSGIDLGDNATVTLTFDASTGSKTVTQNGQFDLSKVNFSSVTTNANAKYVAFCYKISEVVPTDNPDSRITYSTDSFYVDVWVEKKTAGDSTIVAYVNKSVTDNTMVRKTPITFTNKYTPTVTVPENYYKELEFKKSFVNKYGDALPEATFRFSMLPKEVTGNETGANGLKVKTGVALEKPIVDISFNELSDSTKTAKFALPAAEKFAGAGIYRYTVHEIVPSDANKSNTVDAYNTITYDTSKYQVDLTVDKAGYIIGIDITDEQAAKVNEITFENMCATDVLTVKKTVTGTLGDTNQAFQFTLDIPGPGDNIQLKEGTKIAAIIERQNKSIENVTIVVGTPFKFTLKDSEKLIVEGVPKGMIYTVQEDTYTGYDTSIVYTQSTKDVENATGEAASKTVKGNTYNAKSDGQNTPIIDGGNTVEFINNKDAKAGMGVNIDITPFIIVFAIAALGVVFFVTRKKESRF